MIGVAVYMNKMHSDFGYELWDSLHKYMKSQELRSIETKLLRHLYMLPSLLRKDHVVQINLVLNSTGVAASQLHFLSHDVRAAKSDDVDLLCDEVV